MRTDIVYRIDPELSWDFSDEQEWAPGDDPTGRVAVRPVHAEFDDGAHGCVVSNAPHYAAVPELVEAWRQAGLTGFRTEPMVCVPSPVAREYTPAYQPPAYVEVIFTGGPDDDFFDDVSEVEVQVSRRAAEVYSRFDPGEGGLVVGTEDDPYGDSLSDEEETEALRF